MRDASHPERLLQRGVSDDFWRAFRTYYNSDKDKAACRMLRQEFCVWAEMPIGGNQWRSARYDLYRLLVHLAGTGKPLPMNTPVTAWRKACNTLLNSETLGHVIYARLEKAYKACVNDDPMTTPTDAALPATVSASPGTPASTLEGSSGSTRPRKRKRYPSPMPMTLPPPMDEDGIAFPAPGVPTDTALPPKATTSSGSSPSSMLLEGSTGSRPKRRHNRYRSPLPTTSLPRMDENALFTTESGVTASDQNPTPYPTQKLSGRVDELLKQLDRVQTLEADLGWERQKRTEAEGIEVSHKAMRNALEGEGLRANAAEAMIVNQAALQNALEAERQRANAAEAMVVNQTAFQNALKAERRRTDTAQAMVVNQVRRANAAEAMIVNQVAMQNALEAEHQRANVAEGKVEKLEAAQNALEAERQRANVAEAKVKRLARQLDLATGCAFVQRAWIYEWPQFSAIGADMVVIALACGPCVGVYKQWTASQTTHVMVGVVKAIRDTCVPDFAAAVAQGLRNTGRAAEEVESTAAIDQAALEAAGLVLARKVGVPLEHATEDQVLARVQDLVAAATLHQSSWVHCETELIQLLDRYCALRSSFPSTPRDIELWDQKVVTPLDLDGRWRDITRAAGV